MQNTPKALRLHIGIFGRRNVGKSSLLNALTEQPIAIVSDTPGTTTDPVEKTMELLPLGPVVFIDTAGIDDIGALGEMRIKKTMEVFERTDLGLIVTEANQWGEFEERLKNILKEQKIPFVVVLNKIDIISPDEEIIKRLEEEKIPYIAVSAEKRQNIEELKELLLKIAPAEWFNPPTLVGDLLPAGELAVLVVPIDLEAPKGRLILPQVQTIRDILDSDAYCMVVKERELRDALERLKRPPKLVICDSQCVLKVVADTPPNIQVTTFSIIMARFKGDLPTLVKGVKAIEKLEPGDKVLIAEACTHHPIADDIGRVKIPRWLRQYVGGKLEIDVCPGRAFPENLADYKLVIHCGGCMLNRREMLSRLYKATRQGVPITNYGVAISFLQGVLHRTIEPFPYAKMILEDN
ncbi:small GTP-binding protein [Thermodesulfatator indicus DSM 15286]|uniref:Small GTP-binding protein n=1 Tax=Thermodesulfatator indicus (strain DSM 15286 / JCM 11887 / CIR29812) TaxID=667014 RepID=F8AB15_THEID|nr:[FeFe] hydrogenase H-cluster maturation GTPase HydF [Thermodesulfatator indicus]AEH44381.1 small GTP-binding protein [Thermodesulfatator indicus DSM 15286]